MQRMIWYPLMSVLLIGLPRQAMWGASLDNTYACQKQAHPINFAQATREIDEEAVFNLVWNLPQV